MIRSEWVRKTEAFLRQTYDAGLYLSAHPEAKAYRLEHTYRVANIGLRIARAEGLDETGLVIACLLHDVSYGEEFGEGGWTEHGRRSAELARPFLIKLGMPEDLVQEICFGIAIHVDDEAGFPGERTAFALSVSDADNIDRFDVYRIHETLSHDGFLAMSLEEKQDYAQRRLARLRELISLPTGTETARSMWECRLSFYISFYEKLAAQLGYSQTLIV